MIMHSSHNKPFFQSDRIVKIDLEKAEKRIAEVCELTKKFKGFKVKAILVKRWLDAQNCIKQHQMQDALNILGEVERGVKATLVGFFRFSPSFFDNAFQPFLYSSSGELRQKADEAMKKLTIFTAEKWIDLERAAELYQETNKVLEEVKAADPRRRTFSVRPFRPNQVEGEDGEVEEEYESIAS